MSDFIEIGKVLKPQGIRGELKVLPITDDVDRFKKLKSVLIDDNEYFVVSSVIRDGYVYMTFKGVDDRNAAEFLRDKYLCVNRCDAVKKDGRYFVVDVLGATVFAGNARIGKLIDIYNNGGGEIYVVQNGRSNVSFPNVNGVIVSIDTDKKEVILDAKKFEEVALYEN